MQQSYLTVSQLTALVKENLEAGFPFLWVAGEVSNFTRSSAGHCYLTLKDDRAQLRAVIWRSTAQFLKFRVEDGIELLCGGNLELYAARGTYQLVVQQAQPRGMGPLELALRQLRERLTAEGLFDARHKRPLPSLPKTVGIVTSPQGAAIADMLETLRGRWPRLRVLIAPARVQGEGAEHEIAAAIKRFNRLRKSVDVLIVGRGGGSLEDLWAFNTETVVRAIHACKIPVVSAVGHEVDVSLSDLVADVRALTPTDAAQRVVPDAKELVARLAQTGRSMSRSLQRSVSNVRARLERVAASRVMTQTVAALVHDRARRLDELSHRAGLAIRTCHTLARQSMAESAARLEALSPLGVLSRGYSVTQTADGNVIRDAMTLSPGDEIVTRFDKGAAASRIERIDED